ncbi:MAG: hypothetical protein IIB45_03245 [Candidatus Marinimicrobia bacterium]|nr:hypothetical protein [Candidatus Neomarinimicrobiota bacterium]
MEKTKIQKTGLIGELMEGFAKPIAQIKKSKIRLLFVRKLVHSPAIDYVSRLNQTNFTSFFFTHQVLQSPLMGIL